MSCVKPLFWLFCVVAIWSLFVTVALCEPKVLFSIDFEDGLNAVGANPSLPTGAVGGGYEVSKEGTEQPRGVVLNQLFPAQGQFCLQLGHFVVWHIGHQHLSTGQLSFWIMPIVLPPKGQPVEFTWGGDIAKPYQTFSLKIQDDGTVFANYYSWQNNQSWLSGVKSSTGIKTRQWNHVAFTWGDRGQRIYINGEVAGSNYDRFPMSWLQDVKFGGLPAYLDEIELSTSEQVKTPVPVNKQWQPNTSIQKDLLEIEKGARGLIDSSPKGSDAYCRGLVLSYSAQVAWATALQEPPSELALDNVEWMKDAIAKTKPALRDGEIPVPSFDAHKKIVLKNGMILQDGQPTFLLGNYSPTPVDAQIGFNFCNALMPGPDYAMPGPQGLGDRGTGLVTSIDKAHADNKAINILLSLGIPAWLDQMDPYLGESGAGWFRYNIESQSVPAMFQAAADVVIPTIKEHGTNVIINLGNEPAYSGYSPHTTTPRWRAWLMAKHGSITNLNSAWGTQYTSFLEVPGPVTIKSEYADFADPGGIEVPSNPKVLGQWYDWCLFNQRRYAEFFRKLRDNMTRHRPDLLFTIKWVSNFSNWWKSIGYALNPYDVTKVCDFAGCDAWTIYAGRDPKSFWGIRWEGFAPMYDLLKSIAPEKPVLNSENHLLRGDDPTAPPLKYGTYRNVLPWQFFYTAIWEQAIHGGGGGEFWTYWEYGKGFNLTERAKAMDALSQSARDLRRYANEVTMLANERPKIALLLSSAALAWSPKEHIQASVLAYMAMNQIGLPVGYMLEEMLADGALDRYKVLVVPQAQHISSEMSQAIDQFVSKGKIVVTSGDVPQADEYNKPLKFTSSAVVWSDMKQALAEGDWWSAPPDDAVVKDLQQRLDRLFRKNGIAPLVDIKNSDNNIPYGIEWRANRVEGKLVVNACNFSNRPQDVAVLVGGKPFKGVNLLNGQPVHGRLQLTPLQVVLLQSN